MAKLTLLIAILALLTFGGTAQAFADDDDDAIKSAEESPKGDADDDADDADDDADGADDDADDADDDADDADDDADDADDDEDDDDDDPVKCDPKTSKVKCKIEPPSKNLPADLK